MVDYYLVPHEKLRYFTEFTVTRSTNLFETSGGLGGFDPKKGIHDHSALTWEIKYENMNFFLRITLGNHANIT